MKKYVFSQIFANPQLSLVQSAYFFAGTSKCAQKSHTLAISLHQNRYICIKINKHNID